MSENATAKRNARPSRAFWVAWLVVTTLASIHTGTYLFGHSETDATDLIWWPDQSVDWIPFVPVLLLAVPAWYVRGRMVRERTEHLRSPERAMHQSLARAWALSLLVASLGWFMSSWVGQKFGDLPPAYHDEYSYLFQARTFLAGRVSYPSYEPLPELFNQMHVLNEGRFASRYFPGVGVWMAPFVAMGNPWWGHWTAHAIASFLVFWIGRHLADNHVGLLGGLLTALSPGILLFSNLLLAHHPTLVGLLTFILSFLKMRWSRSWMWALLAGTGLTYAMLCRPMTAAGVGLPFGLWMAWWILTGQGGASVTTDVLVRESREQSPRSRWLLGAVLGIPLMAGFLGQLAYNRAITGEGLTTPYSLYTSIYTPRHVFGFNNRIRGEQHLGPKVIVKYDEWAKNLTPQLALQNARQRISRSLHWTLGIVPLALVAIVFFLSLGRWSGDWWLIAAAIVSLHLVHVPYWFEGIMGWHYVFESAPLWLLLASGVGVDLYRDWRRNGRIGMQIWSVVLLSLTLLVNLVTIVPFWLARIDMGVAEVSFSRLRYDHVFRMIEETLAGRSALVLVRDDPSDRHIDYVVNDPALPGQILYGRFEAVADNLNLVSELFPERELWLFDAASGELSRITDIAADTQ